MFTVIWSRLALCFLTRQRSLQCQSSGTAGVPMSWAERLEEQDMKSTNGSTTSLRASWRT